MSYVIQRYNVDANDNKYSHRTLLTTAVLSVARAKFFTAVKSAVERQKRWIINDELEQRKPDHVTFTMYMRDTHSTVYVLRKI